MNLILGMNKKIIKKQQQYDTTLKYSHNHDKNLFLKIDAVILQI